MSRPLSAAAGHHDLDKIRPRFRLLHDRLTDLLAASGDCPTNGIAVPFCSRDHVPAGDHAGTLDDAVPDRLPQGKDEVIRTAAITNSRT